VSILRATFDLLGIDEMKSASGGLRHGVLYDLMGNTEDLSTTQSDTRPQSVQRLVAKFEADATHGNRVGKVAVQLFDQLQNPSTHLTSDDHERNRRKLMWAAQLHEIGSQISHSDYHKHGAYILDNADAMGFSAAELHKLSLLVLGQRGKLRKLEADFEDEVFVQQLLTLRLSIILCHARRDPDITGLKLVQDNHQHHGFEMTCRDGWAESYPQSAHLLREEMLAWQKTPCSFSFTAA